jgi:hypothetical protein
MYKCFEGHKPKIKTLLHVFDHTVEPILTYGIEVWDTFEIIKVTGNSLPELINTSDLVLSVLISIPHFSWGPTYNPTVR